MPAKYQIAFNARFVFHACGKQFFTVVSQYSSIHVYLFGCQGYIYMYNSTYSDSKLHGRVKEEGEEHAT